MKPPATPQSSHETANNPLLPHERQRQMNPSNRLGSTNLPGLRSVPLPATITPSTYERELRELEQSAQRAFEIATLLNPVSAGMAQRAMNLGRGISVSVANARAGIEFQQALSEGGHSDDLSPRRLDERKRPADTGDTQPSAQQRKKPAIEFPLTAQASDPNETGRAPTAFPTTFPTALQHGFNPVAEPVVTVQTNDNSASAEGELNQPLVMDNGQPQQPSETDNAPVIQVDAGTTLARASNNLSPDQPTPQLDPKFATLYSTLLRQFVFKAALRNNPSTVNINVEDYPFFQQAANMTWRDVFNGPVPTKHLLITPDIVGSAPDAVTVCLSQCKAVEMGEDDKIGRYRNHQLPFVGIACMRCLGQPGYGRYFPSTQSSFISSFPSTILRHFTSDCVSLPGEIKDLITILNQKSQRTDSLHLSGQGGKKALMEHVWNKLRTTTEFDQQNKTALIQHTLASSIFRSVGDRDITWGEVLTNNLALVSVEELSLVQHSTLIALHQFVQAEADEADCRAISRNRPSIEVGFIGICCRFCQDDPIRTPDSRVFASGPSGLSQLNTVNKLVNHVRRNKCKNVPKKISGTIDRLIRIEMLKTKRYGSRDNFFARLWNRLHKDNPAIAAINDKLPPAVQQYQDDGLPPPLSINAMIQGSELVKPGDIDMVSNSLLVAFAQLKPVLLTEADRIGSYKEREIGFPGVACKYCNGKASSGRYFPRGGGTYLSNSKDSIMRHLVENCSGFSNNQRDTLIKLMYRDNNRSGWKVNSDSALGAGKVFHQRVWRRCYEILNVQDMYDMPEPELPYAPPYPLLTQNDERTAKDSQQNDNTNT